jgi:isochorismate hydrolase
MTNDSTNPNKEEYVTIENLNVKSQNWLNEIEFYTKNKDRFTFTPQESALLVIDMQQYFLDVSSHAFIPSSKAILPNVKDLVESYSDANLPIIFTKHSLAADEDPGIMGRWWGDTLREEDPLSEIDGDLEPVEGEVVVRKTRYNAFFGTELDKILKDKGVNSVVISGLMTHLCCETTAREAFIRDYEVYFLVDATATQTEELHLSSIRTLSHGFAIPVTTREILSEIRRNGP